MPQQHLPGRITLKHKAANFIQVLIINYFYNKIVMTKVNEHIKVRRTTFSGLTKEHVNAA